MTVSRSIWLIVLAAGLSSCLGCRNAVSVNEEEETREGALFSLKIAGQLAGLKLSSKIIDSKVGTPDQKLTTLAAIAKAAEHVGCHTRLVKTDGEGLMRIREPMIALVHNNQPLVIGRTKTTEKQVFLIDSEDTAYWIGLDRFIKEWNGELLVFDRTERPPTPKIWYQSKTIDLGLFPPGSKTAKEITFFNIGGKPLILDPVAFSCDCAHGALSKNTVASDEAFQLNFEVDTSHKPWGPFGFTVLMTSNDPKEPNLTVKFKGLVKPPFVMDPPYYTFGDIPPTTDELTLTFRINFPVSEPQEIQPFKLAPGLTWIGQRSQLNGQHEVQLRLKLADVQVDDEGRFRSKAVLTTRSGKLGEITVGAFGRRVSWIEVLPKTIYLGKMQPRTKITKKLRVKAFATGPLIASVGEEGPVTCELDQGDLIVHVNTPEHPGLLRSKITLKQGSQLVEVPIVGVVSDSERGS